MSYTIKIDRQYGGYYWSAQESNGPLYYGTKSYATEAEAKAKAERFIDRGCVDVYSPPQPTTYEYEPKEPEPVTETPTAPRERKWWPWGC